VLHHYRAGKIAARLRGEGEKNIVENERENAIEISRVRISDTATTTFFVVISVRNHG
jgi:hypothetical protein